MAKKYDSSDITVLVGLDGVRKHPAMYLGALGRRGVYQQFKEFADNAVDEGKQQRNGVVTVEIRDDNVVIADNGRGIPVDFHPKTKLSGLETVMTMLHAGAKSGQKSSYDNKTIGVHGVGASVSNALSARCDVWTFRNRKWHTIGFECGKTKDKFTSGAKLPKELKHFKSGTVVRYKRDKGILPDKLEISDVVSWCDLTRFFSNVTIDLKVYKGSKCKAKRFAPKPSSVLLKRFLKKNELEATTPLFSLSTDKVRLVAAWTNSTSANVQSHVCSSVTTGGTHVRGLLDAVNEAFRSAMRKELKAKGLDLDPTIGIAAFLDVTIDQPSFEGQAKSVLATTSAKKVVHDAIVGPLVKWIKSNKTACLEVVEHAALVSRINKDVADRKKLAREANKAGSKSAFPKGFVAALDVPAEQRELFLVEGKSAGGPAKEAKLKYQEVLPLRGKLPNVVKDKTKIISNEIILGVVRTTGFDPVNAKKKLRVGRIMLLADADDDGDHITVLLLTMLYKVMPRVFEEKRVYVIKAPLFEALSKGTQVYGDSLRELKSKHSSLTNVHRMKGWGSCEPPLLRKFGLDPATRKAYLVKPVKNTSDKLAFELLMGDDASARRSLIGV